ncbi:MAG: ATP-binding cassette domain-containing protein [Deltaproteobacteria bacterium]|nr:ATP-binding cassette domain-containing protein [Deltaproteobacteria bacterium]
MVNRLDLCIPKGIVYGFLGRNGAGKTTKLRMLMGILAPDQGTIVLGDGIARHRPNAAQRQQIGYASQEQNFPRWM